MNKQVLTGWLLLLLNISTGNSQINIDTASFNNIFRQLNFGAENIVVIGEAHGIKNTLSTEFFIIKNLAEKGYKTLYIEGGESEAAIINMFLQTGDSSILKYTRARELILNDPPAWDIYFQNGLAMQKLTILILKKLVAIYSPLMSNKAKNQMISK